MRNRKKNDGDLKAELSEEDVQKTKETVAKNNDWINKVTECSPGSKIFRLDYNMPQIQAEPIISSLMRPRVFLVQNHQSLVFQNIAIKHNMTFINLYTNKLKDCLPAIKKSNKRDIILCYYAQ